MMKKVVYFAAMLLAGLTMACSGNSQNKTDNNADTDIQENPIEQANSVDIGHNQDAALLNLDEAEDTLWHQGHVFASYPIPDTVRARMQGKSMRDNAKIGYDQLRYLTLPYYDFDGNIQHGEMVCNKAIAHDLLCIFRALFSRRYPIYSIRLVDDFGADDETSMQANNTSCFNYRNVASTNILSKHAFGMAVDINPLQNPCVRGARIRPSTATDYVDRSKDFPHKIDRNDFCREVFLSFGFQWGGDWLHTKDYQHFEKRLW